MSEKRLTESEAAAAYKTTNDAYVAYLAQIGGVFKIAALKGGAAAKHNRLRAERGEALAELQSARKRARPRKATLAHSPEMAAAVKARMLRKRELRSYRAGLPPKRSGSQKQKLDRLFRAFDAADREVRRIFSAEHQASIDAEREERRARGEPEPKVRRLTEWSVERARSMGGLALPGAERWLKGLVYDHPNLPDGGLVTTSLIVKAEGRLVTTATGSVYLLDGEPSFLYLKQLDDRREAFDPESPLRVEIAAAS